jgi:hypothetical protein
MFNKLLDMEHVFSALPYIVWHFIVNLLSQNGSEIQQYGEVALYTTLVVSVVLLATMLWFRPRRLLEIALAGRELGIVLVILPLFLLRFFNYFSRPIIVLGYTFLSVSGMLILAALYREHTMSKAELERAMHKGEQYGPRNGTTQWNQASSDEICEQCGRGTTVRCTEVCG